MRPMLFSLNQRQHAILIYLLGRSGPTASTGLSARFGVSLRTVRYDLRAIRAALKGTGLRLAAKPRTGVWIEGDAVRRQALLSLLREEATPALMPQAREDRLVWELLASDEPVSLHHLAETLGCSRSTILRQLPAVKERLQWFDLDLRRVRGKLLVMGTERDRRDALVRSLIETLDPAQLLNALRGVEATRPPFPEHALGINPLKLSDLAEIVKIAEQGLGVKFTDESYVSLAVHLAVAVQRLRKGQRITMPEDRLAELKRRPEWRVAGEIARVIRARAGVAFPEEDLGYLVIQLSASRRQPPVDANGLPHRLASDPRAVDMADRFIRKVGARLGVDLSRDTVLREGLLWHMQGLLNRQDLRVPARNPLKLEIRQQLNLVYTVVDRVIDEMRPELGGDVSEDEIAYLTVHLAAALERQGRLPKLRVLVVCSSGLGSARLLAARLERAFPEIEIVGVVSALESADSDWGNRADLVVTTVPLPPLSVPWVQVSPLLGPDEMDRVRAALRRPLAGGWPAADPDEAPIVAELMALIPAYAEVKDPEGLRQALTDRLVTHRVPIELAEPIVREVSLLGIRVGMQARAGMAIHLQLALPRFRAGHYVREPDLERIRQEHRALFRAVERGMQLFARWHGVTVPPDEVVPVLRYILRPQEGEVAP